MHTEHGQRILARFLELAGCRPSWTMLNIVEEQVAAIRPRSAAARPSAACPAGWTRQWPRRSSSGPSATGSPAFSSTTGCSARVRPNRSSRTSWPLPASSSRWPPRPMSSWKPSKTSKTRAEAQDHRPGVHPRLRAGRPGGGRRGRPARRGLRLPGPGHAVPGRGGVGGGTGTANIKSHHNVGGLPEDLKFALVEPLRALFKDEVRRVGEELGLPPAIVRRQPFPAPGWPSGSSAR